MSRLILGEFVHAMPHESVPADAAALASSVVASCQEHAVDPASAVSGAMSDTEVGKLGKDEGNGSNCCKSGDCACPCLHMPGTTAVSMPGIEALPPNLPTDLSRGVAPLRPYAFFRPPA